MDDTVGLARVLKDHGVDLLNVSSGGLVPDAKITVGPGYQVPFAARLRAEAGIPVAAVGMITESDQAAKILATAEADAILISPRRRKAAGPGCGAETDTNSPHDGTPSASWAMASDPPLAALPDSEALDS